MQDKITERTRKSIESFIKKNKLVYYSELRALQKKKKGEELKPKIDFNSLTKVVSELEKENKINISYIGNLKIINWVQNE